MFVDFHHFLLCFISFIDVHCCSLISIDVHSVFIDSMDLLLFVIFHLCLFNIFYIFTWFRHCFIGFDWLSSIPSDCSWHFIDLHCLYWFSHIWISFHCVFIDFYIFLSVFIDLCWIPLFSIDAHHGFLWSCIDSRWFPLIFIDFHGFVLIFIDCYSSLLIFIDFLWFPWVFIDL